MDPKFIIPPSPGTPLFAVSPERANRQPLPLPQSPSLPSDLVNLRETFAATGHIRTSSDVQGKVAQFNNLSREAAQRRRDNEAALKRAVMGREEAESETRRLKEENRVLRRDIEEGRGRERKVAERLDGVMEELQRTKETHTHAQALYEKEVRRARKEAFKSSSALVKTQEELKTARNRFTLMREEAEVQRRKVDTREQEAFAAKYQLAGLQEEVESLRQQKRIIEDERDALKTSLKEEEIARIAAEGKIALPVSREGEEFASPKKRPVVAKADSFKENIDPRGSDEHAELEAARNELRMERRLRQRMDDQIHFMKMECQFQCCSCRVAERQGVKFLHDGDSAKLILPTASILDDDEINHQQGAAIEEEKDDPFVDPVGPAAQQQQQQHLSLPTLDDSEPLIKFSPTTGTFYKTPSPPKNHIRTIQRDHSPSPSPSPKAPPAAPSPPQTPLPTSSLPASDHLPPTSPTPSTSPPPPPPTHTTPFLHHPIPIPIPIPSTQTHTTIIKTTTTTIPLASTPAPPSISSTSTSALYPTMTREEALEQIRARRGRARSIASHQGTPRRVLLPGMERRDISAPAKSS